MAGVDQKQTADLQAIKKWIKKQQYLPQNIDDLLLLRFLYSSNNSLEKTKNVINLFYKIRSQAPEIFGNRDPHDPGIQNIFKVIDIVPLPKLTKENYKLFIYRLADSNPDKYNYVNSLKVFFMISDIRMKLEMEIPEGEIPIFDMKGLSIKHITKINLPVLKKYMVYTQEAHPIKLKQIHIINSSSFLDRCLAIIKPFMKSEVASLLHVHLPKTDTLFDFIPKDLLPEEYGGTMGKIIDLKQAWVNNVMENRDYFLDKTRWDVDQTKKAEEKTGNNLLIMDGTFRTLNID